MQCLRNLWSMNGDFISIQYAGTCSTISEVTKTGGRTLGGKISHGMVTIKRFYKNTLSSKEELRQECVDLILSRHNLSTSSAKM